MCSKFTDLAASPQRPDFQADALLRHWASMKRAAVLVKIADRPWLVSSISTDA